MNDVQDVKAKITNLRFVGIEASGSDPSESGTFSGKSSVAEVTKDRCPPAFIDGTIEGHYNCNEASFKIKPDVVTSEDDYAAMNTWLCTGWYNPNNQMLTASCNNGKNEMMHIADGRILPM